jgi:hypothetical protein
MYIYIYQQRDERELESYEERKRDVTRKLRENHE